MSQSLLQLLSGGGLPAFLAAFLQAFLAAFLQAFFTGLLR